MGNSASDLVPLPVQVLVFRGDGRVPKEKALRKLASDESRLQALERSLRGLLDADADSDVSVGRACFQQPYRGTDMNTFRFNLADPLDRAAALAVGTLDPRITKVKPALVPSQMTENEFFRNLFSHVAAIRCAALGRRRASRGGSTNAAPAPVPVADPAKSTVVVIGADEYETRAPSLSGLGFSSKEAFVHFLAAQPQDAGAMLSESRPVHSRWDKENMVERKRAMMELLRVSEPSCLAVLLEESTRAGTVLSDRFWRQTEQRILRLSREAESFTDADTLESPDPQFDALFERLRGFSFDLRRDRLALEAAWEIDPNLAAAFRKLIPGYVTKDAFWGHYFQHAVQLALEEYVALTLRRQMRKQSTGSSIASRSEK